MFLPNSSFKGLPIIDDPDTRAYSSSYVGPSIIPQIPLPKSKEIEGTKSTTKIEKNEMSAWDSLLKMVENLEKKIEICERGNNIPSDIKPKYPNFSWVQPKLDIIKPDIAKNLALFGKPFAGKKSENKKQNLKF